MPLHDAGGSLQLDKEHTVWSEEKKKKNESESWPLYLEDMESEQKMKI